MAGDTEQANEYHDMTQKITKTLSIFGGGAALFYVIGFTVVKTYVHSIGLDGMFILSKEFYIDAGGSFLLEMVRAPLLMPHVFFAYLFLLYLLIPKVEKLTKSTISGRDIDERTVYNFNFKQWFEMSLLFLLVLLTIPIILRYASVNTDLTYAFYRGGLIFDYAWEKNISDNYSLMFFIVVTPLTIISGLFSYRFRNISWRDSKSKWTYTYFLITYVVFLVIIPISYGYHVYDWKLVPIKDPTVVQSIIKGEEETTQIMSDEFPEQIWLLGKFSDRYFFFAKTGYFGDNVIQFVNANRITHLTFDTKNTENLRAQIRSLEFSEVQEISELEELKFLEQGTLKFLNLEK